MAVYPWTGLTPTDLCGIGPVVSENSTVPKIIRQGSCVPAFKQWFYNQILVIPNNVSLGRLLSDRNTQIEVWNGYIEEAQTLNSIGEVPPTSESGVDLIPTVGAEPPSVYQPLESKFYNLAVDVEGAPTVDVLYTFAFSDESPTLNVSGYRLLIFGFMPQAALEERFKWLTDMLVATDGGEQYVKVRPEPRREFVYKYVATDTLQRGRLFNLIASAIAFSYGVPVWQQLRNLTQAALSGATTIYVDTTQVEYEVGGGFFLWQSDQVKESGTITDVFSDRIEALSVIENNYDTKAFCMPLSICNMPKSLQSNLYQANATELTIGFRAISSPDIPAGDLNDQYDGLDVLHDCPEVSGSLAWTHSGNWEDIDFSTGDFYHDQNQQYAKTTRSWSKTFVNDPDGVWNFKQWLYKMAGRRGMFWVPSYSGKIEITGNVTASQVLISITNIDLAIAYRNTPFVTDIEFEFLDGTTHRSDILFVERLSNATEVITIDVAAGKDFTMDDLRQVSLLHKVRLDSDTIVFKWVWANECSVSFNTREVIR